MIIMPDTGLAPESATSPIPASPLIGRISDPPVERDFAVSGMTCASCVSRVEKVLNRVDGVISVSVNLATEKARIGTEPWVDEQTLIMAISKAGYGATAIAQDRPTPDDRTRSDGWMLAISAILSLPLVLPMLTGGAVALPALAALVLASIVQFGPGARFYGAAWNSIRAGTGSMDVLVALGTSAAYGLSLYEMTRGGPLYFEASAVVITLIRFGKFLETRAKRSAARSVGALEALRPELAHLVSDGGITDVGARSLAIADLIEVRPGERVPADARILTGEGHFDEQHITGESLPALRRPGDTVMAGALAQDAALRMSVVAAPGASMIDRIVRLIETAQASKPPVQRLADRIAAWFVPAVVAIAALTFVGWILHGAPLSTAIIDAVSVLVIACPCALGLATPAAIVTGAGVAARRGILIRDAAALEQAHRVDTVVFDKTGTLTEGRPHLAAALPAHGITREALIGSAAALSASGTHPLAAALRAAAPKQIAAAQALRIVPGRGVQGEVDGIALLLGNERLMRETGIPAAALASLGGGDIAGSTLSYLARADGSLLGALAFTDTLRADAREAVDAVKRLGCDVVLLSGDRRGAAEAVGRQLGIDTVIAEADPTRKRDEVERLRRSGRHVAMVGDGLNDAAALAAADLGIAIGSGVDTALEAAPLVLLRPEPLLIADAIALSRRVWRTLWQGLFWALIYNVIGIPLAAFGVLNPMVSGAAMAASSVSVLGNALLLRRWKGRAA
jgi:Cu+-exporting ATPase